MQDRHLGNTPVWKSITGRLITIRDAVIFTRSHFGPNIAIAQLSSILLLMARRCNIDRLLMPNECGIAIKVGKR